MSKDKRHDEPELADASDFEVEDDFFGDEDEAEDAEFFDADETAVEDAAPGVEQAFFAAEPTAARPAVGSGDDAVFGGPAKRPGGDWAGLVERLEKEAEARDGEQAASAWYAWGRVVGWLSGDWEKAGEAARKALSFDDAFGPAHEDLAWLARSRSDREEMARHFEGVAASARESSESAGYWVKAAEAHLLRRDADEDAARCLENSLKAAPGNYFALQFQRRIFHQLQRWADLESTLGELHEAGHGGVQALVEQGVVRRDREENADGACDAFVDALRKDPLNIPAYLALSSLVRRLEERSGAKREARDAMAAALPKDWGWPLHMASAADAESGGRADDATEQLKSAAQGGADRAAIDEVRERMDERMGNPAALRERALQQLKAAERGEASSRWRAVIGDLAAQGDRFDEAREAYMQALDEDPANEAARDGLRVLAAADEKERDSLLGNVIDSLMAAGGAAGAMLELLPLLEGGKGSAEAVARVAETATSGAELRLAADAADDETAGALLERLAEGLKAGPWAAGVRTEAGLRAAAAGAENAADLLEGARRSGAARGVPVRTLARLYVEREAWQEAAELLEQAATSCDQADLSAAWRYRAARLRWFKLGEVDAAEELLRAVVREAPELAAARADLKTLLAQLGRYQEMAAVDVSRAGELDDPAEQARALMAAAASFSRAGVGEGAAVQYERILESLPEHDTAAWLKERAERASQPPVDEAQAWKQRAEEATRDGDPAAAEVFAFRRFLLLLKESPKQAGSINYADMAGHSPATLVAAGILLEEVGAARAAQRAYRQALQHDNWAGSNELAARINHRVARGFEKDGKSDQAAAYFRRAAEGMSEPDAAIEGLERLAAIGDNSELALEARLLGAERSKSSQVRAYYHHMAARTYEQMGRGAEALEHLRRASDEPVTFARVWSACRRHLAAARDAEGLLELYERRLADSPYPQAVRFAAAQDLERAGHTDRADAQLDRLVDDPAVGPTAAALLSRSEESRDASLLRRWYGHARSEGLKAYIAELFNALGDDDSADAAKLAKRLRKDGFAGAAVLEKLVDAAVADQDWDEAAALLDQLSEKAGGGSELAAVRTRRATVAFEGQDDPGAAREHLEAALDADGRYLPAIDLLIRVTESSDEHHALVGALSRKAAALPSGEEQLACYVRIAEIFENDLEQNDAAVKAWQRVLSLDAGRDDAWRRVEALLRADEHWEDLMELGRERADALSGEARRDLLLELARTAFEQLDDGPLGSKLAKDAFAAADPSPEQLDALIDLQRGAAEWPGADDSLKRRAVLAEDADEAARLYTELAELRSEHLHDRDAAARSYNEVLKNDPDSLAAHRFLAEAHLDHGHTTDALEHFLAASTGVEAAAAAGDDEAKAEATDFFYRFGRALAEQDRNDEAGDAFMRALALSPNHLPSMQEAAPRKLASGHYGDAADLYRGILKLTGDTGDKDARFELQMALGRAELGAGDVDGAAKRFRKALELEPGHLDALEGLVDVSEAQSDWKAVLSGCNQLIKAAINDVETTIRGYRRKARVLEFEYGRSDKSIQHYAKLLEYIPDDAEAGTFLAQALVRQGEADKGLARARAVMSTQDDRMRAVANATAAAAALAAGKESDAAQHLDALRATGNEELADAVAKAAENGADGVELIDAVRSASDGT